MLGDATGAPNARTEMTTTGDGTTLTVVDSVVNFVGNFTNTVGQWVATAVVVNGGACTVYFGTDAGALTSASLGSGFGSHTAPTLLSIGTNGPGDNFVNGRVANFKMWQAVLTLGEIQADLASWSAVRTANLLRHHKFQVAETTDYSGNGNTLSGGTGAITEADPPIIIPYNPPTGMPPDIAVTAASVAQPLMALAVVNTTERD